MSSPIHSLFVRFQGTPGGRQGPLGIDSKGFGVRGDQRGDLVESQFGGELLRSLALVVLVILEVSSLHQCCGHPRVIVEHRMVQRGHAVRVAHIDIETWVVS